MKFVKKKGTKNLSEKKKRDEKKRSSGKDNRRGFQASNAIRRGPVSGQDGTVWPWGRKNAFGVTRKKKKKCEGGLRGKVIREGGPSGK